MANEEHLAILKQGVEAWNNWREQNPTIRPDLFGAFFHGEHLSGANLSWTFLGWAKLSEATLSEAYLKGANLSGADLSGADLSGALLSWAYLKRALLSEAWLKGAKLSRADLSGADLTRTDLSGANFRRANLSEANLSGADLSGADLSRANLSGANLESAKAGRTAFCDVDLSEVKGLETVKHQGSSTISIDTLYKSKGRIPEVFLRECDVPDQMITFIASLVGQPETNRVRLRMMIDEHFNKSELQTLCFDMDVDYDSLNGENKSDKARELVAYFQRRETIRDLVAKCKELRPNVSWEGEYE
jgi:hypothetical protein